MQNGKLIYFFKKYLVLQKFDMENKKSFYDQVRILKHNP